MFDNIQEAFAGSNGEQDEHHVKPPKVPKIIDPCNQPHHHASSSKCNEESPENQSKGYLFDLLPEQKAMSNVLVIREVLKSLSVADILKCRQINRVWCQESTFHLLKPIHERSLRISFEWSDSRHSYKHTESRQTLDDFHAFLKQRQSSNSSSSSSSSSVPFLCTNFRFTGGNLKSYDASSFFQEFGASLLRSLTLVWKEQERRTTSIETLQKLFFEWAPKISFFRLESPKTFVSQSIGSIHQNPETPTVLPNLRTFDLSWCEMSMRASQMCTDILSGAVNLKETIDPNLKFLTIVVKTGKAHTIQDLILSEFSDMSAMERFMSAMGNNPPALKVLRVKPTVNHFLHRRIKFRMILEEILDLCKDSLEKIYPLTSISTIHPMNKLPVLEKVRILGLELKFPVVVGYGGNININHPMANNANGNDNDNENEQPSNNNVQRIKVLPPGENLAEVFPNLQELHLRISRRAKGVLLQLEPSQPLQFVHTLRLQIYNMESDLSTFAAICPNLRVLQLMKVNVDVFPGLLRSLSQCFVNLVELEMSVVYWRNPFNGQILNEMDSAMSGFAVDLVQQLRTELKDQDYSTVKVTDIVREFPSLLDLKRLKLFSLKVLDSTLSSLPLFSKVTALLVLNPMKQRQGLNVNIRSTFSLQPIFEMDHESN